MTRRFYNAIATTHIAGVGLFTTVTDEIGGIWCYGQHRSNKGPYWEQLPPIPPHGDGEYKPMGPLGSGKIKVYGHPELDPDRASEGPHF